MRRPTPRTEEATPVAKVDSPLLTRDEAAAATLSHWRQAQEHHRCPGHNDTDHEHIYLAINEIHPETFRIHSPAWDHQKPLTGARALERELGLTPLGRGRATTRGSRKEPQIAKPTMEPTASHFLQQLTFKFNYASEWFAKPKNTEGRPLGEPKKDGGFMWGDSKRRTFLGYLLSGAGAALLILAGCQSDSSSSQTAAPEKAPPAAEAPEPAKPAPEEKAEPAPEEKAEPVAATGETETVKLEVGDGIQYSTTRIEVKAGSTVEVTIEHTGNLPKEAMGHNFVLLKPGTDMATFANAAMAAANTQYIPNAMKDAVIANTKVVGGGESDTISFPAPAPGEYTYLCTFPGHYAAMNGKLIVK